VTELLGCIRERAILKYLPVHVDPLGYLKAEMGTAVHNHLNGDTALRFHGVLGGLETSGELDTYEENVIADYKTSKPPWKDEAYPEHVIQVSLYAELAWQNSRKFTRYVIYYLGGTSPKAVEGDILPQGACLNHQVDETGRTVKDNIELVKWFDSRRIKHQDMVSMGEIINDTLPCSCESIHFGKDLKCDKYCAVRDVCLELSGQDLQT